MGETALDWIDGELDALAAKGLRRSLEPLASAQGPVVTVDGRPMVSLCSNDYLGLASDPRLKRAAAEAAEREGAGAGAARRLAAFKGTEAALLFNSGYHANAGVPAALVGRGDAVFCDVLDHASIVDGCLLSRAELVRYRHCDVGELVELLARTKARRKLVVTDSIFGMDGDAAPLREIAEACDRHGAMLYVDEAHAAGVLGPTGAGLAEALGVQGGVDVHMGTLGKALGSFGAYVAGSRRLVDLLVSRARTFIFTTALPPAACGAALAALDVLEGEPARRERLRARSARAASSCARSGPRRCPAGRAGCASRSPPATPRRRSTRSSARSPRWCASFLLRAPPPDPGAALSCRRCRPSSLTSATSPCSRRSRWPGSASRSRRS